MQMLNTGTYNGPDDQRWFNDVMETENGQSKISKDTGLWKHQHHHRGHNSSSHALTQFKHANSSQSI